MVTYLSASRRRSLAACQQVSRRPVSNTGQKSASSPTSRCCNVIDERPATTTFGSGSRFAESGTAAARSFDLRSNSHLPTDAFRIWPLCRWISDGNRIAAYASVHGHRRRLIGIDAFPQRPPSATTIVGCRRSLRMTSSNGTAPMRRLSRQ